MSTSKPTEPLPNELELVSLGPVGSGTYLMLGALSAALAQAGSCAPPPITVAANRDGGEAILRVAAGGPGVLGACSPAYLTTPVVHGIKETWRTLTPVARLVSDSYLLVVPTGSFPGAAKLFSRPTTVVVPKAGGNTDIQAMLLEDATGLDVTVVVEHDLASLRKMVVEGRAHWTTGVYSDFAAELAAGTLQVIATFDAESSGLVPTLREQGIDVTFPLWRGVIGPGGLPDSTVESWDAALRAALTQRAWVDYVQTQRQRTAYLSAADFTDLLAVEDERYRRWLSQIDR